MNAIDIFKRRNCFRLKYSKILNVQEEYEFFGKNIVFIRLLSYGSMAIMSNSIQKCILAIPDELLEGNLFTLLLFNDLIRLMSIGNARLFHCCDAVILKNPFGK